MKKLIIALVLMFFALPLMAEDTTFLWDLSTSDEFLDPANGGYRLYGSKESGNYGPEDILGTVSPGVNTITIPQPGLGMFYFVVDAFSGEDKSAYSNEVSKEFVIDPPGTLQVTETGVVLRLTWPEDSDTKWSLNVKADGKKLKADNK